MNLLLTTIELIERVACCAQRSKSRMVVPNFNYSFSDTTRFQGGFIGCHEGSIATQLEIQNCVEEKTALRNWPILRGQLSIY